MYNEPIKEASKNINSQDSLGKEVFPSPPSSKSSRAVESTEKYPEIFIPQEDVVQQAIKGERKFTEGVMGYHYRSTLLLCLGYCWGLFLSTIGGTFFIIAVISLIKTDSLSLSAILGPLLMLFFSFIFGAMGLKVDKKIFSVLINKKNKKLKVITFVVISLLTLVAISLLIAIFISLLTGNFSFS